MPYIKKDDGRRKALRKGTPALIAGELNYQIYYYMKHNTKVPNNVKYETVKIFVDNFLGEKPNYQRYNDMTGALVRCARELRRRVDLNGYILIEVMNSYDEVIAKYEDIKIEENGDVE